MTITVTFKTEAYFTNTIEISEEEYERLKDRGVIYHNDEDLDVFLNGNQEFDYIDPIADIEEIEFHEDSIGVIKHVYPINLGALNLGNDQPM